MIIELLTLVLPLVALAIMFLWGLFIGLRRTRIRFFCVAASFAISLIAALWVKNVDSGVAANYLNSVAKGNENLALILGQAGLSDALFHCGGAIIAPWVFLTAFFSLCAISGIICSILFVVFRVGRKNRPDYDDIDIHESGSFNVGSYSVHGEVDVHGEIDDGDEGFFKRSGFIRVALYSVAQLLLTCFVILTPVVSTIDFIPSVMDTLDEIGLVEGENGKADLMEQMDRLNKTPLVAVYRTLGGNAVCDSMSTFKVAGQAYKLRDEVGVIADFVSNIMKLNGKQIQDYTDAEIEILRAIDVDMHDSVFLPTVAGDLIYLITDAWLDPAGNAIFGIGKPTFDKDTTSMFADPFDHILEAFHKDAHTLDALRADFDTLEHTMEILIRSGVVASMNEAQTNSMVELLTKGDTIDLLLAEFDLNPSFTPLKDDITKIGMRAMGSTLKIPAGATENENYEQFTGDLASKLNDMNSQGLSAEEQKTHLTETIRETYAEQMGESLELSDEVVGLYADVLIKEFEGKENVTAEEMQQFFDSYAGVQSEDAA